LQGNARNLSFYSLYFFSSRVWDSCICSPRAHLHVLGYHVLLIPRRTETNTRHDVWWLSASAVVIKMRKLAIQAIAEQIPWHSLLLCSGAFLPVHRSTSSVSASVAVFQEAKRAAQPMLSPSGLDFGQSLCLIGDLVTQASQVIDSSE
jgi:hypothetical protein